MSLRECKLLINDGKNPSRHAVLKVDQVIVVFMNKIRINNEWFCYFYVDNIFENNIHEKEHLWNTVCIKILQYCSNICKKTEAMLR